MDTLRIAKAIKFATVAHDKSFRKGSKIPYIAHPAEVAMLLSTLTDDDDVIIAGLLHDVVEDTQVSLEEIEKEFGERVAKLVEYESEDKMEHIPKSESWKTRKKTALDHLKNSPRDAKLICLCDKLSNMRESAESFDKYGDDMWRAFNQKDKKEQEWYYRSIGEILSEFKNTDIWIEYMKICDKVFGKNQKEVGKTEL
ncbi:MAG: HD domain-containing protein [Lachnospiraceae bacterium]|nr:HD domain-containing protein [Lachnospiraceae bacterium]